MKLQCRMVQYLYDILNIIFIKLCLYMALPMYLCWLQTYKKFKLRINLLMGLKIALKEVFSLKGFFVELVKKGFLEVCWLNQEIKLNSLEEQKIGKNLIFYQTLAKDNLRTIMKPMLKAR